MMNTKTLLIGLLSALLLGCASAYKPSPQVSELKGSMSQAQAIATLNELLKPRHVELKDDEGKTYKDLYGFCSASPYRWDRVDIFKPYASASATGMEVRVFRRGKYLGTRVKNGMTVKVWEEIHEVLALPFSNIKRIRIHRPGLLSSNCMPRNGETELMVTEKDSALHWYVITVPEQDRARLIAAFMTLAPQIEYVE